LPWLVPQYKVGLPTKVESSLCMYFILHSSLCTSIQSLYFYFVLLVFSLFFCFLFASVSTVLFVLQFCLCFSLLSSLCSSVFSLSIGSILTCMDSWKSRELRDGWYISSYLGKEGWPMCDSLVGAWNLDSRSSS